MTQRRITIVAAQLRGYDRVGGAGTATTFLAIALARLGHAVEILYIGPSENDRAEGQWARLYDDAGVSVRRSSVERRVEPGRYARMRSVESVLNADPPEVVVSHDFGAPAYSPLRLRQLGLAFEDVLFVVFCHGTRRWVKEVNRNARVFPDVLAESLLERAAVELADVVVSPSAYMVDWMRGTGWHLPEPTFVIPYLTGSAATGEAAPPRVDDARAGIERIAFFGRLDERKGLAPFIRGFNELPRELLRSIDLEFIGRPTKEWSTDRVRRSISDAARRSIRRLSFETDLDQKEALDRLSRPGTLAVMPSLADNSPNTVYECIERGIPFIASRVGGTGELVDPDDRSRVLFEPTAEGVRSALERAFTDGGGLRAASPAFDGPTSLRLWSEVVAGEPSSPVRSHETPAVDTIVVHRGSRDALARCLSALGDQSYEKLRVFVVANGALPDIGATVIQAETHSVEAARAAALRAAQEMWVLLLDDADVPEPQLVEKLVRAQAASGADIVTCGLTLQGEEGAIEHFFSGEPRGLGVLGNDYGVVALLRRSLLEGIGERRPAADADWPLLARLSLRGARIVSIPLPLVARSEAPGTIDEQPGDGLLVVEEVERALPSPLRSLARLSAGLAAHADRRPLSR